MDQSERLNHIADEMLSLLSVSARSAVISTNMSGQRIKTLDLFIKSVAVELTAESLNNQLEALLESMSEMGEMESFRLQMAMDRLSKMMSTLSNLLKKASDTAQGITQNIK
jgi:hypothetical protein